VCACVCVCVYVCVRVCVCVCVCVFVCVRGVGGLGFGVDRSSATRRLTWSHGDWYVTCGAIASLRAIDAFVSCERFGFGKVLFLSD